MNNNISEDLKKEIEKLFASKFFYKDPSENKIIAYSIAFILLTLLGSLLGVEVVAAFLSVFPLTYVLGAKGLEYYIPLVTTGIVILAFLSSPAMLFWFAMHMIIAYLVYYVISTRNSKMFLVISTATLFFLGIAIYIVLLMRFGVITISSEQILSEINSTVDSMIAVNQTIDRDLLISSIESMQKTFPVTVFMMLLFYSVGLIQYTLTMLSREYIIIPTFPKFSRIMLSTRAGYFYIGLTLIELLVTMQYGENSYNFWYILLQNTSSVLAFVFVLNGLFTAFFFAELKANATVSKVLIVILMLLLTPIFELIGFVDSLFKLRESYIIMKKGR